MHVFTRSSSIATNFLTCLVTGFYSRDVNLWIKRNGRVLTEEDGLESSGVRPNGDNTFQRQDSVELPKSDSATYTCKVGHPGSNAYVAKSLNITVTKGGPSVMPVVVLIMCYACYVCYCRRSDFLSVAGNVLAWGPKGKSVMSKVCPFHIDRNGHYHLSSRLIPGLPSRSSLSFLWFVLP